VVGTELDRPGSAALLLSDVGPASAQTGPRERRIRSRNSFLIRDRDAVTLGVTGASAPRLFTSIVSLCVFVDVLMCLFVCVFVFHHLRVEDVSNAGSALQPELHDKSWQIMALLRNWAC